MLLNGDKMRDNGRKTGLPSILILTDFITKSEVLITHNTCCSESCIQLGEAPFVLHLKNDVAGQEYLFFRTLSYLNVWEEYIKEYNRSLNPS